MYPIFLTLAEVLEIHQDQVVRYGGDPGIRDLGLLKSALGTPMATFGGQFLHTDVFEMAAAYLFHIVQNHPFVDGNRRTGTVAANVFLILNGYEFDVAQAALADMVLSVARGESAKSDIVSFLRSHTHCAIGTAITSKKNRGRA
jgi:death on curing protein